MKFDEIYHETTKNNYELIKKSGTLLKRSVTQMMVNVENGQGSGWRNLTTDPFYSLKNENFYNEVDEVDGVYLRPSVGQKKIMETGVVLYFSLDAMKDNDFILNTEENNGFAIGEEGEVKESQFSGELGFSTTKYNVVKHLDKKDLENAEVVILNNLSLKYLTRVEFF